MSRRLLVLANRCKGLKGACVVVLAACLVAAAGGHSADLVEQPREQTGVAEHMVQIARAMRKIKRNLAEPQKNKASLEWIETVQEHVLAAKSMMPAKMKKLPKKARERLVLVYRKQMIELLRELLDLEQLLLIGKNDAARKKYQRIRRIERKAHERFQIRSKVGFKEFIRQEKLRNG